MASTDTDVQHWLNLFSVETWLEAARHGFAVTGFSPKRWELVQRIRPGDLMVCYLTGLSTYVGLLRVNGPAFKDEAPIWSTSVFPSRLPVTPEVLLRPDAGIPVRDLASELSFFQNMPHPYSNAWTGHFRGSPNRIKLEDGLVIEQALRAAAADPARVLDLTGLPEPTKKVPRKRARCSQSSSPPGDEHLAPEPPAEVTTQSVSTLQIVEPEEELIAGRLVHGASASEDAAALEAAIADAFAFLGFRTERRSGPGDTDVLAQAPLGEDSYSAVVDGKSSRQGRVGNAQIDWYALERHKERHGADHILVVAGSFSGGELTRDAERTGAGLLTTADLSDILRLHLATPFDLPTLRDLFRYPGKPDVPLTRMREHAKESARLQQLLPDIIDAIEEAYRYGLYDPVNADALLLPLASRRGGRAYSREEVNGGLELLCVPQLGILRRVGEGRYTLQMPKATVAKRLRALVAVFDSSAATRVAALVDASAHLRT
jgi:hypothetical protein